MRRINKIAVFGANGAMGYKVSAIFASFGDAIVYMIGRNKDALMVAKENAITSIRSDIIVDKLICKTYDEIVEILPEIDLFFESVFESYEVKREINKLINQYAKKDVIIASGTSGLSINKLSNDFSDCHKQNFLGLHFFNPPYNMTLCEIIPSFYTKEETIRFLIDYMQNILRRTIIVCKDSPGFVANRIGFHFMNLCAINAEVYNINFIDSITDTFTGRTMTPLETADFVGLDIYKSIIQNIYLNTKDDYNKDFLIPEFIEYLISNNSFGGKTGKGLYITEEKEVFDVKKLSYIDKIKMKLDFAEEIKQNLKIGNYKIYKYLLETNKSEEWSLCFELLSKYIIYSIFIGKELCEKIEYVDDCMATGFNWVPPFALVDLLGGKDYFFEKLKEKNYDWIKHVDLDLFHFVCPLKSKYDFRKFMKVR